MRTHLGTLFTGPLEDQITLVQKRGVLFRTVTLEAYIILQATRPDGPREVDVQRIGKIRDHVNWKRVKKLSERLPPSLRKRFREFEKALKEGQR